MTDLDGTLLAKAIVYALITVDTIPEEWRDQAERDDLVHLLHLIMQDPAERERLAVSVEAVTGHLVDLTDWRARNWRLEGWKGDDENPTN